MQGRPTPSGGLELHKSNPLLPKTTPEEVRKAQLRLTEAALRADSPVLSDLAEVLEMVGECDEKGYMTNRGSK